MKARPPGYETERQAILREDAEGRRAEEVLREIVEGTASVTGDDFFRSLVRHLASALRVRYAFITECGENETRARMLAFWKGDGFGENMEYDPRGTPCMNVLEGNVSYHPAEVQALFPEDEGLCELGVQSYLGLPLSDLSGRTIGHLAVLDHKPMQEEPRALSVLKVFASRAAAELDRLHADQEIRALNERLKAAAERSRTLLEINNAIITNLTQETLLSAVCKAMERYIPFDKAGLTLYDPERDAFRFLALEAHSPTAKVAVGITFERAETCSGEAFELRRPVLRRDLQTERRYASEERVLAEGICSLCVVPLIVQGESIGTFNVGSREKDQYGESDVEFLQEVANQIAIAVANTMAFEEITRLKSRLERENLYLQEEIRRAHNFEEIVGDSPALLDTLEKVERVAPTDSTVLISGETGTGKELIARSIHSRSARKDRPLVKVNCGAISAGLVESELFGHVKGAFTGALERRIGRFELADGGTLFLDEVGELPPETQVKLLRVLQEGEFEPVGSSRTLRVDVRIIAATNRNLEQAVRDGRFRADLFYRLNVLPVEVPPLRERRGDIPQLAMFFLTQLARRLGKKMEGISQETMDLLVSYDWPGNIRELQNIIERGMVLSQGTRLVLGRDLFLASPAAGGAEHRRQSTAASQPAASELISLEENERRHILAVLEKAGWVIEGPKGAARVLNLHPNTLRSRMKRLGIKRSSHEVS